MENPVLELEEGVKVKEILMDCGVKPKTPAQVEYLSHSFPGTYYHRKIRITTQDGESHDVDQLHCTAWRDMAAPSDTKVSCQCKQKTKPHFLQILLDLAYAIPSLNNGLSPILVHCSAGVGRTGTFCGFYKLCQDINNRTKKEFSVFETVLEMRRFISIIKNLFFTFFNSDKESIWSRRMFNIYIFTNAWWTLLQP